jgi:zinc protease
MDTSVAATPYAAAAVSAGLGASTVPPLVEICAVVKGKMVNQGFRFPPTEEATCPNGLQVVVVPDREQPAVVLALQFPRGRFADPVGLEGVTELSIALMQKGTRELPPDMFAAQFERTGSVLFAEVGEEHTVVGCKMLSRFAETVVPLFWALVVEPGLADAELNRLKRESRTSLDAELADPMNLALRRFHVQLYGKGHPAGRSHTPRSVGRIDGVAVRECVERICHPAGALLVVAGDVDSRLLGGKWLDLFGRWSPTHEHAQPECPEAPQAQGRVPALLLHKPGLTQTSMVFGQIVPGENAQQRLELGLANYVLGGGNFSSRLMSEIRSRMGSTYGISSHISRFTRFGELIMSTTTQDSQVGEMIAGVRTVFGRFVAEGITEEELAKACSYAIGSLAFQLEGIEHVVERLLWLRLYGREKRYIEGFADRVRELTREGVNQAIREYFCPETLVLTAVGDRAKIDQQVRSFGPVEQRHYRAAM